MGGEMTEPIKLPPDEQMQALVKECGLDWQRGYMPLFDGDPTNRYAVLIKAVVEQATADLRADLVAMTALRDKFQGELWCAQADLKKAEAERDEARAELARLTTPQPACDHDNENMVIAFLNDGTQKRLAVHLEPWEWWTPLPPVKEADK
jgi:hypothetical protein